MKTATEILSEHGINIMSMDDNFNTQLLHAMERYAEEKSKEKDLIIYGIEEGSENWKSEYDNCRTILKELVDLKIMKENLYKGNPDGKEYAERKPKAWEAAKKFLENYQHC